MHLRHSIVFIRLLYRLFLVTYYNFNRLLLTYVKVMWNYVSSPIVRVSSRIRQWVSLSLSLCGHYFALYCNIIAILELFFESRAYMTANYLEESFSSSTHSWNDFDRLRSVQPQACRSSASNNAFKLWLLGWCKCQCHCESIQRIATKAINALYALSLVSWWSGAPLVNISVGKRLSKGTCT